MADFYDIHRRDIEAADGCVHLGEIWNVPLREPIAVRGMLGEKSFIRIIRFKATKNGQLEPASRSDYDAIAEWKSRHRNTAPEAFGFILP